MNVCFEYFGGMRALFYENRLGIKKKIPLGLEPAGDRHLFKRKQGLDTFLSVFFFKCFDVT